MRASRLLFLLAPAVVAAASCSRVPVFSIEGGGGAGGSTAGTTGLTTTSTTATTATTSTTTTTIAGPTCWSAGVSGWTTFAKVAFASGTNAEAAPVQVSADGLSLYFAGSVGGRHVPFAARRNSRAEAWQPAAAMPGWSDKAGDFADLWVGLDEREILVTDLSANAWLRVSTLAGSAWSAPVDVAAGINTSGIGVGAHPLSGDGTSMYYLRNDGPDSGYPEFGPIWRLFVATRPAPATPGGAFSPQGNLQLPPIVDHEELICPVISPDGARLLFGSTYPYFTNGSTTGLDHALVVYGTTRSASGWDAAVHVAELDHDLLETCPTSITADGCELYLRRFSPFTTPPTSEIWVATRTPQP